MFDLGRWLIPHLLGHSSLISDSVVSALMYVNTRRALRLVRNQIEDDQTSF